MSPMIIVLLGPPGVGKGTQAARLAEAHGFVHLATGDMLRAAVAEESALGKRVAAVMAAGALVDDALMADLIAQRLASLKGAEGAPGIVFDGYPRTCAQAETLDALLKAEGCAVGRAVEIEADEEIVRARALGRAQMASGAPRADDKADILSTRLAHWWEKTRPVSEFYKSKGCLVRVDGRNEIERVAAAIQSELAGIGGDGETSAYG